MELLTAVNRILSTLGEAQVTNTDSQHSDVYLILTAIEEHKRLLLERGWWFNTSTVTMYPDEHGNIEAPLNALAILDTTDERLLVERTGQLYDASNSTEFFTEPVVMFITYNIAFEDLPPSAAQIVLYRANQELYTAYFGIDATVQGMAQKEAQSYAQLQLLHLRCMRYTSHKRGGYTRMLTAMGG